MKIANYTKSRILLFQNINSVLVCNYLQQSGFEVMNANALNIKELIKERKYDLCILDDFRAPNSFMTLELLEYARSIDDNVPIIIASSNSEYEHIISAFNKGADDYLRVPMNLNELICRINAVLKRSGERHVVIDDFYEIGEYRFDVKRSVLIYKGAEYKLMFTYKCILSVLCSLENKFVSTSSIREYLESRSDNPIMRDRRFSDRSISTAICGIRKCLRLDDRIQIKSERGIGYRLSINTGADELM